MLLLKYIQSPEFGMHGESNKFVDLVSEFITTLADENKTLSLENKKLMNYNEQFHGIVQENDHTGLIQRDQTHELAKEMTQAQSHYTQYDGKEN